jgi:glutamine amidotransferase-like uncharacterized protein
MTFSKILLPLFFAFILFIWVCLISSYFRVLTHTQSSLPIQKIAFIYKGPGTCDGCPEAVASVLDDMDIEYEYIKPGELSSQNFNRAWLYVQPGGSDDVNETLESLSRHEIKNIRKFVVSGGSYLGICAGGYLAGRRVDQVAAFNLVPLEVEEEYAESAAKIEEVVWDKEDQLMYFQSGPFFKTNKLPKANILATYKKSNHAAALITPLGGGLVGLIGPHPEADADWYENEDLTLPNGSHIHLLKNFISQLQISKL